MSNIMSNIIMKIPLEMTHKWLLSFWPVSDQFYIIYTHDKSSQIVSVLIISFRKWVYNVVIYIFKA